MLATAAILLLPAYLHSCSVCRKKSVCDSRQQTEIADTLIMHQRPIEVGKTWREAMDETK